MENLKKQAKRFQKCLADNGVLKYVITKQEPEIWKLTKQKNSIFWSFIVTEIRRFKGASQTSWKSKTIAERATGWF